MGTDCVAVIAPVDDVKDERPDAVLSRQVAGALGLKVVYKRDLLARLRETHEPQELSLMEKAIDITRLGHEAAARATVAGVVERDVQTKIEYAFFSNGATGLSLRLHRGQRSQRRRPALGPQRPAAARGRPRGGRRGRRIRPLRRRRDAHLSGERQVHGRAGEGLPRGVPGPGGHLRRHQARREHGRPAEGRGGLAQARRATWRPSSTASATSSASTSTTRAATTCRCPSAPSSPSSPASTCPTAASACASRTKCW